MIDDPKISFEDFENFLRFLYTEECIITGKTIEKLLHLGKCSFINNDEDIYFSISGNFYDVKPLLNKCLLNIKKWLNSNNILKYCEFGVLYVDTCPRLLDMCLSKLPYLIGDSPLKYSINDNTIWISSGLALKIAQKCSRKGCLTEDALFKKVTILMNRLKNCG